MTGKLGNSIERVKGLNYIRRDLEFAAHFKKTTFR
jgi:hypothetical protein